MASAVQDRMGAKCNAETCDTVSEETNLTPDHDVEGSVQSRPELVVYKVSDSTAPHLAAVFGLQVKLLHHFVYCKNDY